MVIKATSTNTMKYVVQIEEGKCRDKTLIENLKGRNNFGDLESMWTGFIWLKIGTSCESADVPTKRFV
jgi:hypothetical protein